MKRAMLMLAILALLLGSVGQTKAGFVTLNDPLATGGTFAQGISGSNVVGYYQDGTGDHGFLYDGTSYITLDDPQAFVGNTFTTGISGSNVVGYYNDKTGTHGFLYDGTSYTPLNYPQATSTIAQGISGSNVVGY